MAIYSGFAEENFEDSKMESLSIRFENESVHRIVFNCGLKIKIDLDGPSAFEILSPCCGDSILIGDGRHPYEYFGKCARCGEERLGSFGPTAFLPNSLNHLYIFDPDLRDWIAHILVEYIDPLNSILMSRPIEAILHAYCDAGGGKTSTFLRETMSGNVLEVYSHPLVG